MTDDDQFHWLTFFWSRTQNQTTNNLAVFEDGRLIKNVQSSVTNAPFPLLGVALFDPSFEAYSLQIGKLMTLPTLFRSSIGYGSSSTDVLLTSYFSPSIRDYLRITCTSLHIDWRVPPSFQILNPDQCLTIDTAAMKFRNGNYDVTTDVELQKNGEPQFSITMISFKVGAVNDTSKNAILTIRGWVCL